MNSERHMLMISNRCILVKNKIYWITVASFEGHIIPVCDTEFAFVFCFIRTYLLILWSKVLLEKLASFQLVKKFPAFYGTRRFITSLTRARHLSLSSASPIQSSYPNPTSWRSILMLSSHLRLCLPSGPFPSGFSHLFYVYLILNK